MCVDIFNLFAIDAGTNIMKTGEQGGMGIGRGMGSGGGREWVKGEAIGEGLVGEYQERAVHQVEFSIMDVRMVDGLGERGQISLLLDGKQHQQVAEFTAIPQQPTRNSHHSPSSLPTCTLTCQHFTLPPLTPSSTLQFHLRTAVHQLVSPQVPLLYLHLIAGTSPQLTLILTHSSTDNPIACLSLAFGKLPRTLLNIYQQGQQSSENKDCCPRLTPLHYSILHQLIPSGIISKFITSTRVQNRHSEYMAAYGQYLHSHTIGSIDYGIVDRLLLLLNIDTIAQKFCMAAPYDQYRGARGQGTRIYEVLAGKAQGQRYHDVEKFVWRHRCAHMRGLLGAIKAFDQLPRINFTQPFFWLCVQCMRMVAKESNHSMGDGLFEQSRLGRQSLTFFLILGILKSASHLLLYQPVKTVLSNTSLLFHYVLKKHNNPLYNKFLHIQLNIEAYFGMHGCGLFAELFTGSEVDDGGRGGGEGLFVYGLLRFLHEMRSVQMQSKQPQKSTGGKQQQPSSVRSTHYVSLIAYFLSLIDLFDTVVTAQTSRTDGRVIEIVGNSAAYASASAYLWYFRAFLRTRMQAYVPQITNRYDRYYRLCEQTLCTTSYLKLMSNLNKFHQQNRPIPSTSSPSVNADLTPDVGAMTLGELMVDVYHQFHSPKGKNQSDLRKLILLLDCISLPQPRSSSSSSTSSSTYRPPCLLIQVVQSPHCLYHHQLILPTSQPPPHRIQLKLHRLAPLHLLLTRSTDPTCTYSLVLDVRKLGSNVCIQQVMGLECRLGTKVGEVGEAGVTGVVVQCDAYVAMQVYIRDSTQVEYIENVVPQGYIGGLLLMDRLQGEQWEASDSQAHLGNVVREQYRNDIIFVNKYHQHLRLPECNLNLLYSKLGWYGNHYLIPDNRLTHIHTFTNPSKNTDLTTAWLSQPRPLASSDRLRINQVVFYGRCVYGRGVVPGGRVGVVVGTIREGVACREVRDLGRGREASEELGDGARDLLCYYMDNCGGGGQGEYDYEAQLFQFYCRATKLPLMRYLTYQPLEFYFLEQATMELRVPLMADPSKDSTNKFKQLGNTDRKQGNKIEKVYRVVFGSSETKHFITDVSKLNKELTNRGHLHQALSTTALTPLTLHFTYPQECTFSNPNNRELLASQFLLLLQLNILHYYLPDPPLPCTHYTEITFASGPFPNPPLHSLLLYLLQTQRTLSLTLSPLTDVSDNALERKYGSFVWDNGCWEEVAVLGESREGLWVEGKRRRGRRLCQRGDVIVGVGPLGESARDRQRERESEK